MLALTSPSLLPLPSESAAPIFQCIGSICLLTSAYLRIPVTIIIQRAARGLKFVDWLSAAC
eukprot:3692879-Rhodomonas_salina.2